MPLENGARIGSFEVLALLGAGGMGEVYRARDHKLNRDVALKVISARLTEDEALRRFLREAQSLAALNHPHIAQIYGLEDSTATRALVMELVDGVDLAERMARGPLPLDESLAIASQIADALEAAHDVGIVHRDLKPANVKVRADGAVKVLDFGLAKALDTAHSGTAPAHLANSPTFTSPAHLRQGYGEAGTEVGVILGTASYMSPEQARGKPVDKRADIWAFGVVLFEMLSRRGCFAGETVTDVLAAVVTRDPAWSAIPQSVPPRITRLLRRCLDKDPKTRLRDIGEARVALASTASDQDATPTTPAVASRTLASRVAPWAIASLALAAAVASWLVRPVSLPPLRKLELALPADGFGFTLSPDGQHIAFRSPGKIVVRDLARLEDRDLAESPPSPRNIVLWSRDGQFVAYNDADGRLWSVPARGGTPRLICTIPETRQLMGGAWLEDGSIAFAVWRGSLYKVAATGGKPAPLLTIDPKKEIDVHEVVGLPDGRVIAATHLNPAGPNDPAFRIEVIGDSTRELAFDALFFPIARTASGHLLMRRPEVNAGVWAFRLTGTWPLRVQDGFLVAPSAADSSAANDGALLYSLASSAAQMRELVWVDRTGQITGQVGTAHPEFTTPALSPDGQRVAFAARNGSNMDVFVRELGNDIQSRVTQETEDQVVPSWFPTGRRLTYIEAGRLSNRIVARNADGSGARQELGVGSAAHLAPDGRHVVYAIDEQGTGRLRYSTVANDGTLGPPQKIVGTAPEPDIRYGKISPDGRLVVYVERHVGGALDVSITRFPTGEGRWQLSAGGGRAPAWSRSGELFYAAGANTGPRQMMVVPVKSAENVTVGSPLKLFELPEDFDFQTFGPSFDVTADGKRLIMVRARRTAGQAALRWVLVQNWLSEFGK